MPSLLCYHLKPWVTTGTCASLLLWSTGLISLPLNDFFSQSDYLILLPAPSRPAGIAPGASLGAEEPESQDFAESGEDVRPLSAGCRGTGILATGGGQ